MNDIRKLNNALNEIDERFIEEAAEAGRAERSVPGWVKYGAVIAGGTAAVAAVCIFAANGSRGVDLVAQSGSQTEFSSAELSAPEKSEGTVAFYECGSALLNLDTADGTFTLYPNEVINSTPTGTFTVSGEYISLNFTQLEDVKYRGRLSEDGKEITIPDPDERLYCWIFFTDSSGLNRAAEDNGGNDTEIVFKWSDGAELCGTDDTAETAEVAADDESAESPQIAEAAEYPEYSPEEANEMIKRLIGEDSTEKTIISNIGVLENEIDRLENETDRLETDLDILQSQVGTVSDEDYESTVADEIAELADMIDNMKRKAEQYEAELDNYRTDLDDYRTNSEKYRKNLISEAMARGDAPLSMDGVRVTAYSGYDEWRGGTHYGVDLTCADMCERTVVSAFMAGSVTAAADSGWNHGMGKYIVINHGEGISTVYANLGSVDVVKGQTVNAGEVIGHTGVSGFSTGIHLHFEIRENGEISSLMNSYPRSWEFGWVVGGDGGVITEMMYGSGGYYGHKGIDIAADIGTPALAAEDGTVILAEYYHGYGNCVMIDHGEYVTLYGHLDEISVSEGMEADKGDIVGTIGQSGQTTGPTLHFEVRKSASDDAELIDPIELLPYHERASACVEDTCPAE